MSHCETLHKRQSSQVSGMALSHFWRPILANVNAVGLCGKKSKVGSLVFGVLFGFQNIAPDMSRWTSKLGVMVLHLSKVYIDNMKCSRNQLNAYIAG